MRSLLIISISLVVCTGVALGAQPAKPNEHLKGFRPFIGTWRFEGPSPEEVPGFVEKGSKCDVQFSWRWILDKQAVMQDLLVEFEGNKQIHSERADRLERCRQADRSRRHELNRCRASGHYSVGSPSQDADCGNERRQRRGWKD